MFSGHTSKSVSFARLQDMTPARPIQIRSFPTIPQSVHTWLLAAGFVLLWSGLFPCSAQNGNPGAGGAASGDELFFFQPDTPSKLIRSAILAERLERPALARTYLGQLVASQPGTDTLMNLRREFGIGTFLKLSSLESLHPASRELLTLINEASRQDPVPATAVSAMIADLGQSEEQTFQAANRILAAEDVAVVPLLAADQSTPEGKLAGELLKQNARRFRRGLVAALPDSDESQRARILRLLGRTGAPFLIPDLLRYRFSESQQVADAATNATSMLLLGPPPIYSRKDAARELVDTTLSLVSQAALPFPDESDRLAEQALAQETQPDADLTIYGSVFLRRAVKLAHAAVAIAPDDPVAVAALKTAELAEQAWPPRWPLQYQPPQVDPDTIAPPQEVDVNAFTLALETENSAAILQLLAASDIAAGVLTSRRHVLRKCRLSTDPRVRLMTAALEHAVGMSSIYTRATIASALAGGREKEAVVIDSRRGASATGAAVIRDQKYVVAAANTGKQGFDTATEQLRCELILVHSNCLRWNFPETIANLRTDYRTRATPIIVYGPETDEGRTQTTRSAHGGIWFLPEPISNFTFVDATRLAGVTPPLLLDEERQAMIRLARELR